jgi:hypothetical protein
LVLSNSLDVSLLSFCIMSFFSSSIRACRSDLYKMKWRGWLWNKNMIMQYTKRHHDWWDRYKN